jgi:SRSO17 transposase
MELTDSFLTLLRSFEPLFTAPTFHTFSIVVTGWILSQRHRRVTEIIFSSGHVGDGHWSRFHRFFSHAVWDIDTFSMFLAKRVVAILSPGATLYWAIDDTLCRKRGLTLFAAGMHYDPLISSRAKTLVSWGHDWVILCLVIVGPFWAPTKVFALPIAMRLYRNRQGLTKGKKSLKRKKGPKKSSKLKPDSEPKTDPNHRTRPELALELIKLVARWFSNDEIIVTGDSAYGGQSVLSHLPANVHLISRVHPKGALYELPPAKKAKTRGPARKKGNRLPGMKEWADDPNQLWTDLEFNQFGLHARLAVKTMKALYYKSGNDRLLTIVLTRDLEGKRPDQMFYCTKLDWTAAEVLSAYASRWSIECTFENCKQFLGLEDPANRLEKAVKRTAPMALFIYTLIVVWFHETGHQFLRFPFRPWYPQKEEPSFADMLTTLRRVSYEEKTPQLHPEQSRIKTWIAQIAELLSRAG